MLLNNKFSRINSNSMVMYDSMVVDMYWDYVDTVDIDGVGGGGGMNTSLSSSSATLEASLSVPQAEVPYVVVPNCSG
jgi:hypothetical protein